MKLGSQIVIRCPVSMVEPPSYKCSNFCTSKSSTQLQCHKLLQMSVIRWVNWQKNVQHSKRNTQFRLRCQGLHIFVFVLKSAPTSRQNLKFWLIKNAKPQASCISWMSNYHDLDILPMFTLLRCFLGTLSAYFGIIYGWKLKRYPCETKKFETKNTPKVFNAINLAISFM